MTDQRLLCTSLARQRLPLSSVRRRWRRGLSWHHVAASCGSIQRYGVRGHATQRMQRWRSAVGRRSAAQTVLTDTRFRSWPLERCEPLTARTLRARPIQVGAARAKLRLSQRGPALRHNAVRSRSAQRYASDAHAALRMPRWRSATYRRSTTQGAPRNAQAMAAAAAT